MQEERVTNRCKPRQFVPWARKNSWRSARSWFEDARMRGFLIGLSVSLAFIVGCVAGSSRYGVPKAEAAAVVEQRWSYFCFEATGVDDVSFKANAAGMRGWEMASATTAEGGQTIWCFRQPRP